MEAEIHSLQAQLRAIHPAPTSTRPSPTSTRPCQTFTFQLENPQTSQPESSWITTEIRDLMSLVPKTDADWSHRRKAVLLSEPEAIVKTFFQLIYGAQLKSKPSEPGFDQHVTTEHDLLGAYRRFAMGLKRDSMQLTQLSNFSMFLYLSLCRVAAKAGTVPVKEIDEHMRETLEGSRRATLTATHLRNLRASVRWPINQASELRRRGLGNRADELFLLCESSSKSSCSVVDSNQVDLRSRRIANYGKRKARRGGPLRWKSFAL